MAKRRTSDDGQPQKATEQPTPISYKPARDVSEGIEQLRAKYPEFPPGRTKIIDRALRMYLRANGIMVSERPGKD